jgi:hypothetical protein
MQRWASWGLGDLAASAFFRRARPSASPQELLSAQRQRIPRSKRIWHFADAGESAQEHDHITQLPPLAVLVFGAASRLASLLTHTLDTPHRSSRRPRSAAWKLPDRAIGYAS